ncbi:MULTISPECIES: glutathione S-transferase [Rhodopseudomonas]|uniref:glutathione transferase n=1 Tax=Rhodopseudomonas palustris TaxID=1076 RepID=A0A0D7F793_RHOPL|nr:MULTISPECIES: glutathione S-transferase [Rhodopseudomonas]KIZ47587.1 glutathione S-transferase [Rhodopseudomonas palustris]MDF3809929.1 glutathione S-transferase [Rhodopseudomonas sp. BAL398]WOK20511.1 glutathione S-transferase [Rhodopseudomonas sp. BAL398]
MLTVHHLGLSQSERIVWLCEELDIPYRLEVYQRDPQTRMAPPEYKALHPMQISPVIADGDLVLAESGAIIEYILAKYGHGRLKVAPDDPAFADYLFWFHFVNGTLMPSESIEMLGAGISGADQLGVGIGSDHPFVAVYTARTDRGFAMIEQRLGKVPYLAGADFSAADIIMLFALTTMRAFTGRRLDDYPNIRGYLARIGGRPAYQRAMTKGDPELSPMLS